MPSCIDIGNFLVVHNSLVRLDIIPEMDGKAHSRKKEDMIRWVLS